MVKGYKTLSIKEEVFNKAEKQFNEKNIKESFSSWISEYLLLNLEKDEFVKNYAPFLSKIGIEGNRITIRDEKKDKLTDVYFKNNQLYCNLDEATDCIHIHYVLCLPELARLKKNH